MRYLVEKYKNFSLPLKTTIWFLFCSFFLKGISFISAPIFTRILSTEEYGIQSIFSSYEQVFLILSTFEMAGGAYVRGLMKYKSQAKEFLQGIILLSTILTSIVFCFFLIFSEFFCDLSGVSIWPFILMFAYLLLYPSFQCWMMKGRFEYQYKKVVVATIFMSTSSTLCSLLAVIFISPTAECKIISGLIVNIIICSLFFVKSCSIKVIKSNWAFIKETMIFSLKFQSPLVLHSLSYLILAQMDRIMIGALDSKTNAAIYSVAYSVAVIVSIFQSALRDSFSPYRLKSLEKRSYGNIKKSTSGIVFIVFLVILIFLLIIPEGYKILFPEEYQSGIKLIPPITTSMFFMALYGIFVDVEEFFCKTKYVAIASSVAAVMNIILNYFGMLFFGYEICAYTTLVTYMVMAFLHFLFTNRILRENKIKTSSLFDLRVIVLFSIISFLLGVLCDNIYSFVVLRYFILFVILILVLIFRKKIIAIIKER